MAIPIWVPIAAAAGLGVLLFGSKSTAAQKPAPKQPNPVPPQPVFKPETPVFKPPQPTPIVPKPVDKDVVEQLTKQGAVTVKTTETGSVVMQKPDGGLVTVMPTVDVTAGQGAKGQARVATQRDPLNVRDRPSTDGKVVGKVARNTIVDVTGPVVQGKGSVKGWAPIRQGNIVGFASVDYLEMGG